MNKLVYRYIIRHYQYVSFDVFDTLIERDVNRPSDIFVLVGKCILGKENAEKFRILRKKAEFEAREENNHKEITLDQIYEKLRGLRTNDTWYGMTYKEDVAVVKESFRGMLERGVYKEELFCDIK